MRIRLPLYAKISLWFFLNLIALTAVFALLFNAQFNFNLDWLLAAGGRDRLEAVRNLIVGDLNAASPDEWGQVLERYSEAHRVRFALFDEQAGALVGGIAELPEEVRARIQTRTPPAPERRPEQTSEPPAAPEPSTQPGSARRRPWQRPLRAIMRTYDPTRYWLLASARLDNPQTGDPLRVVLVARSNSMSAGGLIFDPKPWLALGLGAVVFSLLFWLPLVGGISRSLARMTHATRQIAEGRFDVRINARRRDELGSLSESIDQMAARLDGFVQGQKRFLGDIAHELCAPLSKLQMALGILEQRAHDGQPDYAKAANEKAAQIATLVNELLSFSKASFSPSAIRMQPVEVRAAAEQAAQRETAEGADIRLEVPNGLSVAADPDLLVRALSNLVRNAIQHAASAGPIILSARETDHEIAIAISDSGPGVPADELPKLFDAFYRVDTSRARETGGTGLGLTIVKTCVESCGGTVTARNREPHGLELTIRLASA